MKENLFKTKKTITLFAIISLMGGFAFLGRGITGNTILSNQQGFELIPVIGLLLILCSVILAIYAIKK